VTASTGYQVERSAQLRPGESVQVAEYRLTFNGLRERQKPGLRIVEAQLAVEADRDLVGTLITDAVRSPAEAYVYFGFTHAAMSVLASSAP